MGSDNIEIVSAKIDYEKVREQKNSRIRLFTMQNHLFFICVITNIVWLVLALSPLSNTNKLILSLSLISFQCFVLIPFIGKKLQDALKKVDETHIP